MSNLLHVKHEQTKSQHIEECLESVFTGNIDKNLSKLVTRGLNEVIVSAVWKVCVLAGSLVLFIGVKIE